MDNDEIKQLNINLDLVLKNLTKMLDTLEKLLSEFKNKKDK